MESICLGWSWVTEELRTYHKLGGLCNGKGELGILLSLGQWIEMHITWLTIEIWFISTNTLLICHKH